MLLTILYWVILVLAIIGVFVPVDTWAHVRTFSNLTLIVLFIIIGLRVFKTAVG